MVCFLNLYSKKNYMNKLKSTAITLAVLCTPMMVLAQPGFESSTVTDTPVNGAIWLLVAVGTFFGVRKLYQVKSAPKA
jgi:hypothetical protein